MNSSTIIISAIFLAVFMLPFALSRISRAKREGTVLAALRQLAAQHNLQINHYELCANSAIGLDDANQAVCLYRPDAQQVVYIASLQTCKAEKQTRTMQHGADTVTVTERVTMRFVPKGANTPPTTFVLFNEKVDTQIGEELQLAETWAARINKLLGTARA